MASTIRVASEADAEGLLAIYGPIVRENFISFEEEVPSVSEFAGRVGETLARFPWLVAEQAGRVLGYAYAGPHRSRASYRWSVDVAVYVHPAARGQGVARALYELLLEALRAQGYANAFAGIALPNPASVALHEALGFEPVGVYRRVGFKQGQWRDVGWWQLALAGAERPAEPLPFPAVASDLDLPRRAANPS